MRRPVGTTPEVLGPDEAGDPCPHCGRPTIRRHHAYDHAGTLILARTAWCRACQVDSDNGG